jgi:predicted dehydrogenase
MRIGFIGCGKISHHYARALISIGGEVSAVAARTNSQNLQSFSHAFPEADVFYSWETMIKEASPDALILCISWDQIEKVAIEIIKRGIPVLIEKPVALSYEKAQSFLNEAGGLKGQVMVGYNRRFYRGIQYLKDKLQKSSPLSVDFEIPDAKASIIEQRGSQIEPYIPYYMTSHWIDLIHYTLGDITLKDSKKILDAKGKFTGYYGLYESAGNGYPITIRINYDSPARISFKYIFEDETLHFLPIEHLTCLDHYLNEGFQTWLC